MSEKATGKATPKVEAQKVATKEKSVQELQKQVNELTEKLNAIPKSLSDRIDYFNQKKELIRKLARLESNAQSLQVHLDAISELAATNDFESDEYMLTIENGSRYSKNQVFALQNPTLIGDVLIYMLAKIEAKAESLRKEIEA